MKIKSNLGQTLSLALLSLLLAFFFWVAATEAQDPMIEKPYPLPIPVEIRHLPAGMVTYGAENAQVRMLLRAPESLWAVLQAPVGNTIQAYVDLSEAEPGQLTLPVQVEIHRRPVQVVSLSPDEISLTLEPLAESTVPVEVRMEGTPALGFVTRSAIFHPREVTVTGPQSLVSSTVRALVKVSVDAARETLRENVSPLPVDEVGNEIEQVTVTPRTITLEVPVEQLGNIRDVAVHVVLIGQPASGYWVSSIEKDPPSVAVSGRRDVVKALPGYLNTQPIDLAGRSESFTTTVGFQTPEGISVLTTPQVQVSVNIEPLESTLTVELTPELRGLAPGYTATVTPKTVQLVVRGPFANVGQLNVGEIEAALDVRNLAAGEHTVPLDVTLPDETLKIEGIIPQSSLVVQIAETP
ncbi:MAG: CdaR family protein [Anaerolineae bacterium]